ncbi:hypothetical protein, partial [Komagataeibacter europaeus]
CYPRSLTTQNATVVLKKASPETFYNSRWISEVVLKTAILTYVPRTVLTGLSVSVGRSRWDSGTVAPLYTAAPAEVRPPGG